MPTRVARSFRIASNIVAAAFIITIVVWNYGNFYKISIPPEFKQLVRTLGVDQRWKMFAPVPVSYNGWNIIDGTLESGEHVNVFDPTQPLSMTRPSVTHVAYGNMRWLKYFEAMDRSPFVFYRPYLAAYFCRSWNETHSERNRLARVDITFVRAPTLPNYLLASTTRYVLTSTTCDILPVKN